MSRLSPDASELLARLQKAEAPDPDFEARVGRGLHRRLLASSAGAVGVAAALGAVPKAALAAGAQVGVTGATTAGAATAGVVSGAGAVVGAGSIAGIGATSWVAGGLTAKLLFWAGISAAGVGLAVAFRTPEAQLTPHAIVAPAVVVPLDGAQIAIPGAAVANQPATMRAPKDAPRTAPSPLPAPVVGQDQPAAPPANEALPQQPVAARQQLESQRPSPQRRGPLSLERKPSGDRLAAPEAASVHPRVPSSVDFASARAPSMLDEVNDLKRADELLEQGRLAEAKQVLRSSEARHTGASSDASLSVERHALDLIARCRGATGTELQAVRVQARAFAQEHAKSPLLGRVQRECGS